MIEREKTYLARELPQGLEGCPSKAMEDIYIENGEDHLHLRVRKNGDRYEITKKGPLNEGDASVHVESTIPLEQREFESLTHAEGRRVSKIRYYYPYQGKTLEVDMFQGDLKGLVLVDVEFENDEELMRFEKPDFCLVDVTQEEFIAGGMLAGKKYSDVEGELQKFDYKPLYL